MRTAWRRSDVPRPRRAWPGPNDEPRSRRRKLAVAVRAGLLSLCWVAALGGAGTYETNAVLTALAIAASLLPSSGRVGRLVLIAECAGWAAVVVWSGTVNSAASPYVLAPVFLGTYRGTLRNVLTLPAVAVVALGVTHELLPTRPPNPPIGSDNVTWLLLALITSAIGAWIHRLTLESSANGPIAAQAEAHRLLVQLGVVARRLPGSLDPAATAEALLLRMRRHLPVDRVDRGLVLVRSTGQQLVPVAYVGADHLDWDLRLSAETPLADAWVSQEAQVANSRHVRIHGSRPSGSSLVLPLTLGVKTFGLVALESPVRNAYPPDVVASAKRDAADVALSLDTSLLFDEIRAAATAEERQRLAREVHDGIAQELVYLGYAVDEVLAADDLEVARAGAAAVRAHVTRLISELRMSLFNLRSAVDPQAGLGAALGEHVRLVGSASDLTVHLSLKESALRLPPDVEAELFRIAQEAIANVRKHSSASNLWITCHVDPPAALVVVEDDGGGLTAVDRPGSYGIQIMRERALRARGSLDVTRRPGGGTRVAVQIGTVNVAGVPRSTPAHEREGGIGAAPRAPGR